jgi:hypothetical protein
LGLLAGLGTFLTEDTSSMEDLWADQDRDFKDLPFTKLEMHLLHAVSGAALALGLNALVAIFFENSHYRGMAVFLFMIFFGVDGLSYILLGKAIPGIVLAILGLGGVGLIIHAMEPGVFTKDKNGSPSPKKTK